jgi:cytoskeletal protein CcmA (bactofilin family)
VFKRRKIDESETIPGHAAGYRYATDEADAPEGRAAATLRPSPRAAAPGAPVLLVAGRHGDSGLGVPPFRPAPAKEGPAMARAPLNTDAQIPAAPAAGTRPAAVPVGRLAGRDAAERRMLVVGRGIGLQGTVQDAERLVVEGTVEASTIQASELLIAPGGVFKGEIEVEDAEVAGTMDGTLTARASLVIRASGRVLGTARCRRLQVEDGGQISGRVEMLGEGAKLDAPRLAEPAA